MATTVTVSTSSASDDYALIWKVFSIRREFSILQTEPLADLRIFLDQLRIVIEKALELFRNFILGEGHNGR
jgi:hypothetical protein